MEEKDVFKVVKKVLKDENKEFKKIEELIPAGLENDTSIYIAKLKNGGFIVVSADDAATPVLVVNSEAIYEKDSLPPGLLYLLEKYQLSIKGLKDKKQESQDKVKDKWKYYLAESNPNNLKSSNSVNSYVVGPLIDSDWMQYYKKYNRFCPDNTYEGCVAITMARILYYWRNQVMPTGSNSYDGLSADFGNTNYHWCEMLADYPDDYNSLLIYHAGVSCNTEYGSKGSSSNIDNAESAFLNYWGMNAEVKARFWNLSNWETMLKNELDLGRPIYYRGEPLFGSAHAWIIDGYKSTGEFRCRWGFPPSWDSDCFLGDFEVYGNGPYNQYEKAIFNLYPVYQPGCIVGPSVLTGTSSEYRVSNPKSNTYIYWSYSTNIKSVYGGIDWIALKAASNGTGWIEATYQCNGKSLTFPKTYVSLIY